MALPRIEDGRRKHPRFSFSLSAENSLGDASKAVKLINVSQRGCLLMVDNQIGEGSAIKLLLNLEQSEPCQITGRVVWTKGAAALPGFYCGIQLEESPANHSSIERILSCSSELTPEEDRRTRADSEQFPLKRRNDDYLEEYYKSPYYTCLESFKDLSSKEKIRLVILEPSLAHLKIKLRNIFPEPRLITMDQADAYIPDGTLIVLNLNTRRCHESFTFLNFEEYLLKEGMGRGAVHSLARVSRMLPAGASVWIASFGEIKSEVKARKFLTVAKFEDIEIMDGHIMKARKRALFFKPIHDGAYNIQEVESKKDIDAIQEFSARFYSNSFNFNKVIDDLFTDHSDFFKVINAKTGALLTAARVTWQLPNHFLPCQLAHKKGGDLHLQLSDPDSISYGEIYAPYLNAATAGKIYGEMVRIFYSYVEKNLMQVILTTYQSHQKQELRFLSRFLGFKETGLTLTYGDFGSDWDLVYSRKEAFDDNIKIRFVEQPKRVPSLIKKILE